MNQVDNRRYIYFEMDNYFQITRNILRQGAQKVCVNADKILMTGFAHFGKIASNSHDSLRSPTWHKADW